MLNIIARRVAGRRLVALPIRAAVRPSAAIVSRVSFSTTNASYAVAKKAAASKKSGATTTKKTTAAKKPAAKKTAAKKTAAKKKPAAKKKKTVAKKKPAAKKKVPLTPEQKTRKRIAALRAEAQVKAECEGHQPQNVYGLYIAENIRGVDLKKQNITIVEALKSTIDTYKSLSPSELESYKERAKANKATNQAITEKWINSKTPAEIMAINKARRSLARLTGKRVALIDDTRIPKRPLTAYFLFAEEKRLSGAMNNLSLTETAKQSGTAWKSLSSAEKQAYIDRYNKEKISYDAQMTKLA